MVLSFQTVFYVAYHGYNTLLEDRRLTIGLNLTHMANGDLQTF